MAVPDHLRCGGGDPGLPDRLGFRAMPMELWSFEKATFEAQINRSDGHSKLTDSGSWGSGLYAAGLRKRWSWFCPRLRELCQQAVELSQCSGGDVALECVRSVQGMWRTVRCMRR